MKNKVYFIVAIFFLLFGLISCGVNSTASESVHAAEEEIPDFLEYVRICSGIHGSFYEYRDIETGVHYFVCREVDKQGYGRGIGVSICPRYNADGTLYVD